MNRIQRHAMKTMILIVWGSVAVRMVDAAKKIPRDPGDPVAWGILVAGAVTIIIGAIAWKGIRK